MKRSHSLAWLVLFGALSAAPPARHPRSIFVPEAPALSAPVEIRGTIKLEPFYGPPNYGETPESDRQEMALILKLDAPICISSKPATPCKASEETHEIQLIWPKALGAWPHEGDCVQVKGRLFRAYSGYHRRPLLLSITETALCSR